MSPKHAVFVFLPGSVERNASPGNDKWTFSAKVDGQVGIVEVFAIRPDNADSSGTEAAEGAKALLESGDITISGIA
jgi:hypothetical protein